MTIRLILILPLIFASWISLLAVVMVISDDAPGALVLFPSQDFLANAPDGTAILSYNSFSITVTGASENFTRSLYRAGATLVLPAGLAGCVG